MRIRCFLPHVRVFGGVRRHLELGNAWTAMGHEVTIHHPGGDPPDWLPFRGAVASLDASRGALPADLALCGDPHTFAAFRAHPARVHVYYCVLERDPGLPFALADPGVTLAANSGRLRAQVARRARRPVIDGAGGIDLARFHPPATPRPGAPLRVLVNGRRSRPKKGTDLVLAALRRLARTRAFETVLFDSADAPDPRPGARTPPETRWVIGADQDALAGLYRSCHVFVAAERKAGWCNTALEAMASGCAVVCTSSGTADFARHEDTALVVPFRHPWFLARAIARLLDDAALRSRLAAAGPAAARPWSWERLAARLLEQLPGAGAAPPPARPVRVAGA